MRDTERKLIILSYASGILSALCARYYKLFEDHDKPSFEEAQELIIKVIYDNNEGQT